VNSLEQEIIYRFSRDHEWVDPTLEELPVGISDYAQDAMGDMVFVDLPRVGNEVETGSSFTELESTKSVSDIHAPVSGTIVSVNHRLVDSPELINEDPYGDGWIAKIRPRDRTEISNLDTVLGYKFDTLGQTEHHFYLDQDRQLRYRPTIETDQALVDVDSPRSESLLIGGLIDVRGFEGQDVYDEFEELINTPGVQESVIQSFLEQHPQILTGVDFAAAVPQVVLRSADETVLRPDFILRPYAGRSQRGAIVELKRPDQLLVKARSRHGSLYSNVNDAIDQLRSYQEFFDDRENRETFNSLYKFGILEPHLMLVIGRSQDEIATDSDTRRLARLSPIQVATYDDLLSRYGRLVELRRK